MNKSAASSSYKNDAGMPAVSSKNERVELQMKILRYGKLARQIATAPDTVAASKNCLLT
jgi:hypothetical protein